MDYSDDDEDMLYNYVYDESVFPDIGDFDHQHRLVGGRVSKPRAWLALMVIMQAGAEKKKQQYNCGGTLINSRNVKDSNSVE